MDKLPKLSKAFFINGNVANCNSNTWLKLGKQGDNR